MTTTPLDNFFLCINPTCYVTVHLTMQDSGAPYHPDPIQLRLSGLAGHSSNQEKQITPPPSSPPSSYARRLQQPSMEALPPTSLNVPFLTSVISSLTAEKLAAILVQNSALGPSSIVGTPSSTSVFPQQQVRAGSLPILHLSSLFPSSLPRSDVSVDYGTGIYR